MIYLDYVATTPLDEEIRSTYTKLLTTYFANSDSAYAPGYEVSRLIEQSRAHIAKLLHVSPDELIFTSCASESNNTAIKGTAFQYMNRGKHIITTAFEHSSVANTFKQLEEVFGFDVDYVSIDSNGHLDLKELESLIREDTILVSTMYVNNEVGTIQKIAQIGKIAEKNDILFHTDAVQAYGQLLIDVKKENIDLLSASAHKFNGPKGVGFLYIRKKIPLPEYIHGGKQERNHRAGTENVPGIAGMGKAAEIAFTTREYREKEIQQLRDYLIRRLQRGIPYCRLNGSLTNRLPGNCNISFQFIEGNELLLLLDEKNICASAASACSTGDTSPSHVLTAMGIPEKLARGTLRLTIGYQNTQEEIDYTVQCIKEAVEKLRENAEDYRRYKETFPCNIM
mgnify:CR=1 FL=1